MTTEDVRRTSVKYGCGGLIDLSRVEPVAVADHGSPSSLRWRSRSSAG